MPAGIEERDSMFSVRQVPWHGLGVVLDEPPATVEAALAASGLGWRVRQDEVLRAKGIGTLTNEEIGKDGRVYVPELEAVVEPVPGYRFNMREDTGDVLGVVSDEYKVVQNEEAFRWLEALLGGDLQWETAGSLGNGKRVWVLATPGELVEIGGDPSRSYIYAANSHDGSMAVTAAATSVRIVCANTWNAAIRQTEDAPRTYRFRHTGDLQLKLDEARRVMEMTLDWDAAWKKMGDKLARERISLDRFDRKVVKPLLGMDDPTLKDRERALANREENREIILNTFDGKGPEGDTSGNSPGTKWCAANAIAEFADWGRRYTVKTDQVQRSFEDAKVKQRGLDLVVAA